MHCSACPMPLHENMLNCRRGHTVLEMTLVALHPEKTELKAGTAIAGGGAMPVLHAKVFNSHLAHEAEG